VTPKQETVTIPNASVLNNNVINYTAICRECNGQLLLYTTITLGYDVPWRKVHEVLMEAAKATDYIVTEPEPFVLQTNLNDFNVSYQLNAYTTIPEKMPRIYSALHQNIQDKCNEADIEILSPHFSALRDGNHSTIPANYLPKDYVSPGFAIQNPNHRPS
ncbi:MAG: mechanosensitive ion channel family protein, partial [Cyanobacteria bacterium P01_D01_bin.6]